MARRKNDSPRSRARRPRLDVPTPPMRSLQVCAVDPSTGKRSENQITVRVPWEPLLPGPTGRKIAVIDYDAANKCYYPPINLDDPLLLANDGLDPTEADPRFHQQMVYAIASRTVHMFEVALGREVHWRRADRFGSSEENSNTFRKTDDIRVLKLYPHAMQQANAYYSPQAHGILFGFFTANKAGQGRNLPATDCPVRFATWTAFGQQSHGALARVDVILAMNKEHGVRRVLDHLSLLKSSPLSYPITAGSFVVARLTLDELVRAVLPMGLAVAAGRQASTAFVWSGSCARHANMQS